MAGILMTAWMGLLKECNKVTALHLRNMAAFWGGVHETKGHVSLSQFPVLSYKAV